MTKDTVVAFRAPEGFSPDPLTDLLRQGARDLIAQAVEAELSAFLSAHADETDTAGRRRLFRHGHLPERDIQTGIGAVTVQVPRVRDRAPEGTPLRFTSTILPPYLRRAKSIEELNRPSFAGDQLVRFTRPYRVYSSLHRMPPLLRPVGCFRLAQAVGGC